MRFYSLLGWRIVCRQQYYDISFIILTWNSADYIDKCLESIDTLCSFKVKIHVIDNGSRDNTPLILREMQGKLQHVKLETIFLSENRGTTVSRNMGIRNAVKDSKYLCILDSDTVINEAAMQRLMKTLDNDPKIGIVGPMMKGLDGKVQNSGRGIPTFKLKLLKVMPVMSLRRRGEQLEVIPKTKNITTVGYLMSACWMLSTELVEKIGLLDERIFYAPEDVEYCMRAWKNGYKVCYDRDAVIIHAWQRLSRKKLLSKHNWEHLKGLMYLFHKYNCYFRMPDYIKL